MGACLSNEELIQSCASGKPRAWKELIRRAGPMIFGTSRRILSNRGLSKRGDIAEEIHQEVFVDILEKGRLQKLKNPELLDQMIQSLAISRTLDRVRRIQAYESKSTQMPGVVLDSQRRLDARHIIEEEFKNLNQKELSIMKFFLEGELKHREIAELLGIPIDTVSTVVRRSKEKIKLSLRDKGIHDF